MWLLINVDDVTDVGNNEKKRYLLSDHLTVADGDGPGAMAVIALGTEVHPATKDIIDEIWCDDDDTL